MPKNGSVKQARMIDHSDGDVLYDFGVRYVSLPPERRPEWELAICLLVKIIDEVIQKIETKGNHHE